ncbi:MAG: crossover junction endodeoxyribonuclease RuvC [Bacteroidales bacterium]|nr:crossover junction endodeoxyribonuclease RuvC [Bacteroidales bacterium]
MEGEQIILGIDPGTTVMGYGIIKTVQGKPVIQVIGVLDQRRTTGHYHKISRIFELTLQLIDEYKPDVLAIEAPFYGNNVQSLLKLGRAQGAAIAAALYRSVPVVEYAPRKIKQSITGYGNASKEQVALLLQKTLNIKILPENLDATDGLAAAMCHFYRKPENGYLTGKKSWKEFIKKNPYRIK